MLQSVEPSFQCVGTPFFNVPRSIYTFIYVLGQVGVFLWSFRGLNNKNLNLWGVRCLSATGQRLSVENLLRIHFLASAVPERWVCSAWALSFCLLCVGFSIFVRTFPFNVRLRWFKMRWKDNSKGYNFTRSNSSSIRTFTGPNMGLNLQLKLWTSLCYWILICFYTFWSLVASIWPLAF